MDRPTQTAAPAGAGQLDRPVWREALIVFGVALLVRALYLLEAGRQPGFDLFYMDQEYHLEWARSLATGVWRPPYDTLQADVFFRAPLYPYFLAGIFQLFGPQALAAKIVQMVIGSLSCALAYAVGTYALGRRVGFVAGLLCAIYWVLVYFDGTLLLPVLQVFFLLAGTLAIFLAVARASRAAAAAAGLAFGLYAITRADILPFLPVALWWLWRATAGIDRQVRLVLALLFALGCCAAPGAVTLRNRIVGGDWVLVASQGGVNFYIGNNPRSNGMQAVVPGTRETWWGGREDTIRIAEQAAGRSLRPSEVSSYWYRQSFAYITAQPGHWLRLTGRKAAAMVLDPEIPNNEPYEARRGRSQVLSAVPLSFGILFGLFLLALPALLRERGIPALGLPARSPLRQRFVSFILLFLVVYALTVIAYFVTGRFRVPLIPFVSMGAAVTLVWLWRLLRARRFGPAIALLLLGAALIGILRVDHLRVRAETRGFAVLSDAQDLLDVGDLARAIPLLERVRAERLVRAPQVYHSLLSAYLSRNAPADKAAVERTLAEGLALYPDDPELLRHCALIRFASGDLTQAADCIAGYLAVRPRDITAIYLAAGIASGRDRRDEALSYLQRAEALDARHPLVAKMRELLGVVEP